MGMCLQCFSRIATTIFRGKVQNNFSICMDNKQQAKFEALAVTRDASLKVQEQTMMQSSSRIWCPLQKKRIIASKFGLVANIVSNFDSLVGQLNPSRYVQINAIKRGIECKPHTARIYANSAKGDM